MMLAGDGVALGAVGLSASGVGEISERNGLASPSWGGVAHADKRQRAAVAARASLNIAHS